MGLVIYELIQRERYCNDEDGETVHCARVKAKMHCAVKPFVVPNCDDEQLKSIVEKCIHLLRSERYLAIEAFKALKALPLNSPYISVDMNVQKVYLPNEFHVYDSKYQLIRPKIKDDVKIAPDQPKTTLENTVDFDFFGDLTVDMAEYFELCMAIA
ncbi:unnamed protein product, partial [Mesorhabditis belari]|uniref:Uncharacterized protein n=1 Tax=Mesorhabditis belari TaxID=2138241 RepID=A0AAF3EZV5_9BILA